MRPWIRSRPSQRDGTALLLNSKFNLVTTKYARKIRAERDIQRLEPIHDAVACATSLDAVRAWLR